ncbi:MAG: GNAT family N-acetyltransferase [Halobacteriales archaeon]
MPGAVYLEGEGLVLRTIEEDDLEFLRDTINDPAVRRHLPNRLPLNLEGEREFYEDVIVGDDDTLNLLIWQAADGESDGRRAGTIGVHGLGSIDGTSEIGLFLEPGSWGRGLGTEASRLVTDWAFREQGRHRVIARVTESNDASAAIWEKLGYRHEATLREAGFQDGEYVDEHLYAVLEDEWRGAPDG